MKKCTICKEAKPLVEFNKHSRNKDGKQPACRDCNKERSRAYYKRNPELHRKNVRRNNLRYLADINQKMVDYLNEHPCVDCGETDILVLEFDHLDPSTKVINVGEARRLNWTWERILQEIAKCEVVCANDHKRRTARQFGSYRLASLA